MEVGQLLFHNSTETSFQWLKEMYRAMDSMNLKAFGAFLAEEVQLYVANKQVAKHKREMLEKTNLFWQIIKRVNHKFIYVYQTGNTLILEAKVDYTRKDDQVVMIPCTAIIERNKQNLITQMRVYLDVAPIYP